MFQAFNKPEVRGCDFFTESKSGSTLMPWFLTAGRLLNSLDCSSDCLKPKKNWSGHETLCSEYRFLIFRADWFKCFLGGGCASDLNQYK
jgi:hypothetical protein